MKLDTVSIAGIAVFSALATLLAAVSQALGLNFPVVPYLQFDLGEVAIIVALFIFGPVPAVLASVVEAAALEAFGQNLPYGPILKLFALLSSTVGLWIGTKIASKRPTVGLKWVVGSGMLTASATRSAVLTFANYYLIVYIFTVDGLVGFLRESFGLVGVSLTEANALILILAFTALFNVLQQGFALLVSYAVLRVPAVSNLTVGGRPPWIAMMTKRAENTKLMTD